MSQESERVDVDPMVSGGIASELLGGHVLWRPDGHPRRGHPDGGQRGGECLGDPEIRDECVYAGTEYVGRLHVAVYDAALVREGERVGDVLKDA
jgi:hypothetical protein